MNKRQKKKAKRKEILKRIIILDSLSISSEMKNHKKTKHKRAKQLIRLVENFHHMMGYGRLWSIAQKANTIIIPYPTFESSHDEEPALECFERWKFKPYDPQGGKVTII